MVCDGTGTALGFLGFAVDVPVAFGGKGTNCGGSRISSSTLAIAVIVGSAENIEMGCSEN